MCFDPTWIRDGCLGLKMNVGRVITRRSQGQSQDRGYRGSGALTHDMLISSSSISDNAQSCCRNRISSVKAVMCTFATVEGVRGIRLERTIKSVRRLTKRSDPHEVNWTVVHPRVAV